MSRRPTPRPPRSAFITAEGRQRLEQEYQRLWSVERPKLAREVGEAAALGDRSENAEYIYGKRRLREIDARVHFLGKRLDYVYQVKALIPGERFVMATDEGPFPMETTYSWEDTDGGGTKMSLRNRGRPSGFSRITAPLLAGAMRRANRKDLRRLKAVLEG